MYFVQSRNSSGKLLNVKLDTLLIIIFILCFRSKVNTLIVDYVMNGFTAHHCPINEEQMPSILECAQIIDDIHTSLRTGRKVLIQ